MGLIRIILVCLLACAGCMPQQAGDTSRTGDKAPPPGSFFTCPGEKQLKPGSLLSELKKNRFILIGEGHRNKCDHEVQAGTVKLLAESGERFSIGLEMVNTEMQPVLDRFNSGKLALTDLKSELNWEENWGYDFGYFSRIFELARGNNLPVYALNLPKDVVRTISRKGLTGLSDEQKSHLPGRIIPAPEEQKKALAPFFSGHSKMLDKQGFSRERFFLSQAVWESKMAWEAACRQEKTRMPMLILAGSGHIETGWGIGYRLTRMCPEAKIIRLLPKRKLSCQDSVQGIRFYCPSQPRSHLGMVLEKTAQGVRVERVVPGSKAAGKGIKKGDLILSAAGEDVSRLMDLHTAAVRARQKGNDLCLEINKNGSKQNMCFSLGGRRKE